MAIQRPGYGPVDPSDREGETNRDDWPTTVAKFSRYLGAHRITRRPEGFRGQNIMTPDALGYVAASDGSAAEVSTGHGIGSDRVFGVTFAPRWGESDPRSKCCHSWAEVVDILADPWQYPSDETREVSLALDNDPAWVAATEGVEGPTELRTALLDAGLVDDLTGIQWWWVAGYRRARRDDVAEVAAANDVEMDA